MFKIAELPKIAAAPIIKMPVPKKNDIIIEILEDMVKDAI